MCQVSGELQTVLPQQRSRAGTLPLTEPVPMRHGRRRGRGRRFAGWRRGAGRIGFGAAVIATSSARAIALTRRVMPIRRATTVLGSELLYRCDHIKPTR